MEPSSVVETPSPTVSQRDQWIVESQVFQIYQLFSTIPPNAQSLMLELQRDKHIEYLSKGLRHLGSAFSVLDANRPWLCYWIIHAIALLGETIDDDLEDNTVDFLNRCQDPNGGFAGGPGQMPHLATTYASVNTLITLGGDKALASINRDKLYGFMRRMKQPNGGFRMHDEGEIDVRACYTAISVASVLNILDDELIKNVGDFILSCQTYEGGIAGEPGSEAHGGYTFCGLAAMILIGEANRLDLPRLLDWVVFRQGKECGFQGRTNKLVDGCYSFWQGGAVALLQRLQSVIEEQMVEASQSFTKSDAPDEKESSAGTSSHATSRIRREGISESCSSDVKNIGLNFINEWRESEPLFHSIALQQYILLCAQEQEGGLRDKPGKRRDHYHSCYCLSGLSLCQYSWSKRPDSPPLPKVVMGPYSNLLEPIHPLFNVVLERYREAHEFFSGL
ncbi:Protein farnesyltransferase subunit beta [Medicago truncatula]|uniref:Protein farnesyltransferase subunit beta n=1 Tax=Medicago truncatula TaxID=3880 RepID=A0A072U531_MEDTR|nr:protein farnesyltransferase subunit beta [Medicago truncatula]KEH24844.1 farnesyltranstransferase subunit beta [Medicago truncatula]RHN49827.1 Protein farnesyltransferase subunit beta [Medicago truncatula]